jgi:hypothetical protein
MDTRLTCNDLRDRILILQSEARRIRAETAVVLGLAREVRELRQAESREADERSHRAREAAVEARHMAHSADPTSSLSETPAWMI